MRALSLEGQQFGRLTVLKRIENSKSGKSQWRCQCQCGEITHVIGYDLTSGNTKSCGCSRLEAIQKTAAKLRGRTSARRIDLVGKRFTNLVVLEFFERREDGINTWKCKCDCGKEAVVRGDALRNGITHSCGCLAIKVRSERMANLNKGRISPNRKNLTGRRFGRLIVHEPVVREGKPLAWRCTCDCGKESFPTTAKLISGHSSSCGCWGREKAHKTNTKHGDSPGELGKRPRLYHTWAAMKRRCNCKSNSAYKYYGGKGVTICDDWQDYVKFKEWAMASGYDDSLTIDRIDSSGNYCPENCQWVTMSDNIKNMHRARGHKVRG